MQIGFPHVRTVIHVGRQTTSKGKTSAWENAYYLSSHFADEFTPEQWLTLIREHWAGCEIRNHWRKDAVLFEDKTRSRNAVIVGNLVILRNLVLFLFIKNKEHYDSLPAFVEAVAESSAFAWRLIKS